MLLGKHGSCSYNYYVKINGNKMAAKIQCISIKTLIFHMVVNLYVHAMTLRSVLWCCPTFIVVMRLLSCNDNLTLIFRKPYMTYPVSFPKFWLMACKELGNFLLCVIGNFTFS